MYDDGLPTREQKERMWRNIKRRLIIPDDEKANGLVWVVYPLCMATPNCDIPELYQVEAIIELAIRQENN